MIDVVANYLTVGLDRWRRATDAPLLILAIGTLPLLLLETVRHTLTGGDRLFLDVVNVLVLVAFATDYIVELCLARPRASFVRGEWTSLLIWHDRRGRWRIHPHSHLGWVRAVAPSSRRRARRRRHRGHLRRAHGARRNSHRKPPPNPRTIHRSSGWDDGPA
jgi:hypothetical protein